MRNVFAAGVLAAALLSTPAFAESPFDGTWLVDQAQTKIDPKPVVLSLRKGLYHCATCEPAYSVKADGQYHPVKRDYTDAQKVTVVSSREVRSEAQRGGKVMGGTTWTVSADGKTLTSKWWNVDNAKAERMSGTNTFTRLGQPAKGMNLLDGSWRQVSTKADNINSLKLTMTLDGDHLVAVQPTGEKLDLMLGGPRARVQNDPTDTWVSGKRIDASTVELSGFLGDKPQGTQTLHINADGSLSMTSRSPAGVTFTSTARKQ